MLGTFGRQDEAPEDEGPAGAGARSPSEEAEKLIDHEAATREAVRRAENAGIVFIDEIDKIATKARARHGADVSREGVQRDLLPIVEGSTVTTKYGPVKTDHVLFIAAGAFHVSKPSDLIPELQGRFPIRVELEPLTADDFVRILTEPKNALTAQYAALLATEGVDHRLDARRRSRELARDRRRRQPRARRTSARAACTRCSSACSTICSFDAPDIGAQRRSRSRRRSCASGSARSSRTRICRAISCE